MKIVDNFLKSVEKVFYHPKFFHGNLIPIL
jgi:hypothetical protein